ncbi:helix-turn-helix domain-containing protein [[Clostridium] polysaccharolyticum]|uniref:Helix-turn-helix domain-containing protein n=1 Tax=[Clostridium] polysaccharolyticum TaxID=29364 RepID=A0A1H9YKF7_9FIRM|nr:helix-turn-helix transcriptional regulator [[Clostridium] polysaccharolyticum]SES69481.1 Helix-turn-helix domain-containing protein [[Clostridium] polysaccharolyticum]
MNERIKSLRKVLDLTQTKFAQRIGSTQNTLANYELGRRNPSSSVINNICKEFNVNEDWLREGKGEMFKTLTPDQELADFVGELFSDDCEPKKKEFFRAMAKLPDEFFIQMMKAFEEVQEEKEKRED